MTQAYQCTDSGTVSTDKGKSVCPPASCGGMKTIYTKKLVTLSDSPLLNIFILKIHSNCIFFIQWSKCSVKTALTYHLYCPLQKARLNPLSWAQTEGILNNQRL